MKEKIFQFVLNYKDYDSADIMNLNQNDFLNSSFKKSLIKDKMRSAKLTNNKFYFSYNDGIIRTQFDENTNRLSIELSKDIKQISSLLNFLKTLNVNKIEIYFNSSFINGIKEAKLNNYTEELVRKDKFINEGYEDLVVMTYMEGK